MKDLSYIAAKGMRLTLNATNLIFDSCCNYAQVSYCVLDSMCLEEKLITQYKISRVVSAFILYLIPSECQHYVVSYLLIR